MSDFLTTRQVGELASKPEWYIRRVLDALDPPVGKFGHKRMIPRERLPEIFKAIADKTEGSRNG